LDDIELRDCELLTNASLKAIAEYCHNLRRITLLGLPMKDEGFMALVSNNHDLEYIHVYLGPLLTKDGIEAAVAQHKCHKLNYFGGCFLGAWFGSSGGSFPLQQYRRFYIEA